MQPRKQIFGEGKLQITVDAVPPASGASNKPWCDSQCPQVTKYALQQNRLIDAWGMTAEAGSSL